MAKYLVTGGCGFIGSHLVDALVLGGHDVIVLDNLSTGKLEHLNPNVKFVNGDITDFILINKLIRGIDGCFHLAALVSVEYANSHWATSHQINLTGSINIFECAKSTKNIKPIPVVYASSASIYGNSPAPFTEATLPSPLSIYAVDKLSCEYYANVANKLYHMPSIGLRLFNVYGPRQDPKSRYSRVISNFFEQIISNKPVKIFGDGHQARDFIYVSDAVNFFLQAMFTIKQDSEIYNVCTGRPTTINQLLATMKKIMPNHDVSVDYLEPEAGDIYLSLGDPSQALQRFGCKAKVELERGLNEMLKSFYKAHQASEQLRYYKKD